MGNYFSCSFISPTMMKSSKEARVIFPSGEIRPFREPVKAAELMLECPNFFLANCKSLNIGRRFSSLSADDDIQIGNSYIMFPMRRVNSVVTAADMALLFMGANSAAKRISGAAKVRGTVDSSPESEVGRSRLNLDEVEGLSMPEFKHRLAVCRSKKPLLDTITEDAGVSPELQIYCVRTMNLLCFGIRPMEASR